MHRGKWKMASEQSMNGNSSGILLLYVEDWIRMDGIFIVMSK